MTVRSAQPTMRVRRRLVAALYLTGLLLLSHGVAPAAGSDFARVSPHRRCCHLARCLPAPF